MKARSLDSVTDRRLAIFFMVPVVPKATMSRDALPLYQQIADELRQDVQDAVFQIGDRLPTETELSNRFSVNRHTLRCAMEVLRHEGSVNTERGRGTFVVAAPHGLYWQTGAV
ncbi:MAG: GntR family transcriptional regulator [Cyanobacteria bacterium P01_H01_bin.152]